jgi:hypothetical protein
MAGLTPAQGPRKGTEEMPDYKFVSPETAVFVTGDLVLHHTVIPKHLRQIQKLIARRKTQP